MQEPVLASIPIMGTTISCKKAILPPTEFDAVVNGESWHNGVHMDNFPLFSLPPEALDDLPLRDLQLGLVQEDLEHGVLVVADRIETAALDF